MYFSRALLITGSNGAFFCESAAELLFSITESECIFGEISKSTDCFAQVDCQRSARSPTADQLSSFTGIFPNPSQAPSEKTPEKSAGDLGFCWGSLSNRTQSKYRNRALNFICCVTNRLMFQDSIGFFGFFFKIKQYKAHKRNICSSNTKAMNR